MSGFILGIEEGVGAAMHIAVFDIEAKVGERKIEPFLLGFYNGSFYLLFEGENCVKEFCDYLLKNIGVYSKYKIFAHSGGTFDFAFLIEEFEKNPKVEINAYCLNSRVFYLSVKYRNRTLKFYDSFAILPLSLEKLTHEFGVEHRKLEIDRERIYDIYLENPRIVKEYLYNDVMGLFEVLDKFYNVLKEVGGELRKTIASISHFILSKYLKEKGIKIERVDKFRGAYFGGRVEVFKRYGTDLYYYDFNSLYPSVMAFNPYPITIPKEEKPQYWEDYDVGFVYAKVKVKEDCYIPPLPYKLNDKLIFPVGEFSGLFVLPEFKNAVEHDLLEDYKIYWLYVSESEFIFKDFILELYKRRLKAKEEGNKVLDLVFKLIMNSSYGKFAEREVKEKLVKVSEENLELLYIYPLYFGDFILKKEYVKLNFINVPIASHITAYARIQLFNTMFDLHKKGYEIYYCDTDSIITNAKLPSSKELGKLKLEYKIKEGVFYAPKLYALRLENGEEIVKAKGFAKGSISFKQLYDLLFYDKPITITFKKLAKLKESMKRLKAYHGILQTQKSIRIKYDKRIVLPDKINTLPIKIS